MIFNTCDRLPLKSVLYRPGNISGDRWREKSHHLSFFHLCGRESREEKFPVSRYCCDFPLRQFFQNEPTKE
jgi:hypothetical protein